MVKKVEVREVVVQVDGSISLTARVHISLDELTEDLLTSLPLGKAVKSAMEEGRTLCDDDGPNSVSITVKRAFPTLEYLLVTEDGTTLAYFSGVVAGGRPSIRVVEGVPSILFKVDASILESDIASVCRLVGLEEIYMKTAVVQDPQLDMFEQPTVH